MELIIGARLSLTRDEYLKLVAALDILEDIAGDYNSDKYEIELFGYGGAVQDAADTIRTMIENSID